MERRFSERWRDPEALVHPDAKIALVIRSSAYLGVPAGTIADESDMRHITLTNLGTAGHLWRSLELAGDGQPLSFGIRAAYNRAAAMGEDRATTLSRMCYALLHDAISAAEFAGSILSNWPSLERGFAYTTREVLGITAGDDDDADWVILKEMFLYGAFLRDAEDTAGPAPPVANDGKNSKALSGALYHGDLDAYRRLAGWIIADDLGRPQLSEELREISTRVFLSMLPYFDPGRVPPDLSEFGLAIARLYGNVSGGAYALARSEEWDDMDIAEGQRLLNHVASARADESHRDWRVRVVRGVVAQLDAFDQLTDFVQGQPASVRLASFAETQVLRMGDSLGPTLLAVPADDERVDAAIGVGWRTGVTLAVLERIALHRP